MSTTTIRLPDDLRARIEKLAVARGNSAHGFMVEAAARAADEEERRLDFEAEAGRRLRHIARTCEYLTPDDLRTYALALTRGEKPACSQARKKDCGGAAELQRFRASLRRTD